MNFTKTGVMLSYMNIWYGFKNIADLNAGQLANTVEIELPLKMWHNCISSFLYRSIASIETFYFDSDPIRSRMHVN